MAEKDTLVIDVSRDIVDEDVERVKDTLEDFRYILKWSEIVRHVQTLNIGEVKADHLQLADEVLDLNKRASDLLEDMKVQQIALGPVTTAEEARGIVLETERLGRQVATLRDRMEDIKKSNVPEPFRRPSTKAQVIAAPKISRQFDSS